MQIAITVYQVINLNFYTVFLLLASSLFVYFYAGSLMHILAVVTQKQYSKFSKLMHKYRAKLESFD